MYVKEKCCWKGQVGGSCSTGLHPTWAAWTWLWALIKHRTSKPYRDMRRHLTHVGLSVLHPNSPPLLLSSQGLRSAKQCQSYNQERRTPPSLWKANKLLALTRPLRIITARIQPQDPTQTKLASRSLHICLQDRSFGKRPAQSAASLSRMGHWQSRETMGLPAFHCNTRRAGFTYHAEPLDSLFVA